MPVGREFKIERTNPLDELCLATPAISQGKLLIAHGVAGVLHHEQATK